MHVDQAALFQQQLASVRVVKFVVPALLANECHCVSTVAQERQGVEKVLHPFLISLVICDIIQLLGYSKIMRTSTLFSSVSVVFVESSEGPWPRRACRASYIRRCVRRVASS